MTQLNNPFQDIADSLKQINTNSNAYSTMQKYPNSQLASGFLTIKMGSKDSYRQKSSLKKIAIYLVDYQCEKLIIIIYFYLKIE